MIFGIGCDLCKCSRFSSYFENQDFIHRFFNNQEIKSFSNSEKFCEYYASRFAAKEAFVKALGTGFENFSLNQIYVKNNDKGKPELFVEDNALERLESICPNGKIHLSLSHEKEFAQAFVVIEQ